MRLDDFFGDGVVVDEGDLVLKAHLRVAQPAYEDAVSQEVRSALRALYEPVASEVLAEGLRALEAEPLERGGRSFCVSRGWRAGAADLFKAQAPGGGQPKPGAGQQGPRKDVQHPGMHGGKWYRSKTGKIRYGQAPQGDSGEEKPMEAHEVREHLRHFRPTPFVADKEFVQHLLAHAEDFRFPVGGLFLLNWWYGGGMQKFMSGYALAPEDLRGDLSKLVLQDEEMGNVSYEEAVHHFLSEQDWGRASKSDVEEELRSLLNRYHTAISDPQVQDEWENVGKRTESRQRNWFAEAHAREPDYEKLATAAVSGTDPAESITRMVAAMAGLGLLIVPEHGKSSVGGLKGLIVPNSSMLAEKSSRRGWLAGPDSEASLMTLSAGQLMAVHVAAALHAMFEPEKRRYEAGYVPATKLGRTVLAALRAKAGISADTAASIGRNLDDLVNDVAERLNAANRGEDPAAHVLVDAGRRGSVSDEAIEGAQKAASELARLRETALKAREDETFDLPPTMAGGKWGGMVDAQGKPFAPFTHQKQGMNWALAVKRGVIAPDLGTGKTGIVVGVSEQLRKLGKVGPGEPVIVVVPPSLVFQWAASIQEYAPGSGKPGDILNLYGTTTEEKKALLQGAAAQKAKYIIISSGALGAAYGRQEPALDKDLIDILRDLPGPLFVDEVHSGFRNAEALRHQTLKHVIGDREYAFGVTGTPMPNAPSDVYNLVNLFVGDKIGTRAAWEGRFHGVQWDNDKQGWDVVNPEEIHEAKKLLKPFMFVKLASDAKVRAEVGDTLRQRDPENYDLVVPPEMRPYFEPGGIADKMAKAKLDQMEEKRGEPYKNRAYLEGGLALGFRRQAATSPSLIDPEYKGPSPKIERAVHDIVSHFGGGHGASGAPVVVFSSFPRKAFPLLRKEMLKAGIHASLVGEIHGGTGALERRFQQDQVNAGKVKVLLVGIKAGGAGLELQHRANRAVFLDDPWDPGTKSQAIRRILRFGQRDLVAVATYRMASEDAPDWTVEDRIAGKQVKAAWLLSDSSDLGKNKEEAASQAKFVTGRGSSPAKSEHMLRLVDAARREEFGAEILGEEFDIREGNAEDFDLDASFRDVSDAPDSAARARLREKAPHLSGDYDQRAAFRAFVEKHQASHAKMLYGVRMELADAHEQNGDQEKADKFRESANAEVQAFPQAFSMKERAEAGMLGEAEGRKRKKSPKGKK